MHRVRPILWALLLLTPLPRDSRAADPAPEGPTPVSPKELGIGQRLPDLPYTDLEGQPAKLSDHKSAKAVVIAMTSTNCPVARRYTIPLSELARNYAAKGVTFIALNSSPNESTNRLKQTLSAMRQAGFTGPYVPDPDQKLGKTLGARSTTEVFVLDRARTLVYRGAIDDQYGLGYSLPQPRTRCLAQTLDAVLNDDPPPVPATTAPGCVLGLDKREGEAPSREGDAALGPSSATPITYHHQISRLLQNNCVECHRPGENGPFTLTSYADAKANAPMIRKVVAKGIMPPWFAKSDPGTFHNDRSLSQSEKDTLTQWIDAGSPEGDVADAPIPRKWVQGWRIGPPDLILQSPKIQKIPATGTLPYKYVTVPTGLAEDQWVQSMEVRPTAPEVVHHILVFIELPRTDPRRSQFRGHRGGTNGYFAGMVPGQGHITFPQGTAKLLPKGATLVFQIHYTTNGTAAQDQPRIGFKFAKEQPKHTVVTAAASNRTFEIPPHADHHPITASHMFFRPTRLLSVNPHSHVRGKAFKYELVYPDGQSRVILDVPRYAFDWQLEYQFARPIDVPAGTRLQVTGWYDNSKTNPANPDPDKAVKFGEQTWEEMMIGYFTGHLLAE